MTANGAFKEGVMKKLIALLCVSLIAACGQAWPPEDEHGEVGFSNSSEKPQEFATTSKVEQIVQLENDRTITSGDITGAAHDDDTQPSVNWVDLKLPKPDTISIDIDTLFKTKEMCFTLDDKNVECFDSKAIAMYFYTIHARKK